MSTDNPNLSLDVMRELARHSRKVVAVLRGTATSEMPATKKDANAVNITPNIKNAFYQCAANGISLEKIEEVHGETQFTARVAQLGRSVTVGCTGHLTPKQAESEARRVAAYLSLMAAKGARHEHASRT